MGDALFNADAARVLFAQVVRQLQQRLAQALFAVHRQQVGDGRLLVGKARRQVVDQAGQQPFSAQQGEKLGAGQGAHDRGSHGRGRLPPFAQAGQAAFAADVAGGENGQQTFVAGGRQHDKLDLPAVDEVDDAILVAKAIEVGAFGHVEGGALPGRLA